MNRYDIAITDAGTDQGALTVTRSGDLALTAGNESVIQRAMFAAGTPRGGLLFLPDYGASADDALGGSVIAAGSAFAAAWREQIRRDSRVRSVTVRASLSATNPGRIDVRAEIGTSADIPVTVSYQV